MIKLISYSFPSYVHVTDFKTKNFYFNELLKFQKSTKLTRMA